MEKKELDLANPDVASIEADQEGPFIDPAQFPHLVGKSREELRDLEVRVRRRVDLRLLPTLVLIYILNYLDRYVFELSLNMGLSSNNRLQKHHRTG